MWLEKLGVTHGDLKISNMGIDNNRQLTVFDFGSVRYRTDEGYSEQVVEDHFTLATCVHFLASGSDALAKVNSYAELKETVSELKGERGIVHEAAKDYEGIIQAGWIGNVSTFSSLQQSLPGYDKVIADHQDSISMFNLDFSSLAVEKDPRWMDEEAYREA